MMEEKLQYLPVLDVGTGTEGAGVLDVLDILRVLTGHQGGKRYVGPWRRKYTIFYCWNICRAGGVGKNKKHRGTVLSSGNPALHSGDLASIFSPVF